MDQFPQLQNFFGAWLNQDYHYNGDSLDEIVLNYKESKREHDLDETRQEIANFLAKYGKPGQDLTKSLEDIFSPGVTVEGWDGMTTREFLLQIDKWLALPIPGWEPYPYLRKLFKRGLNPNAGKGVSLKVAVSEYKRTLHKHELDRIRQEIDAFLAEHGRPGQDLDQAFRETFSLDVPLAVPQGTSTRDLLIQLEALLA